MVRDWQRFIELHSNLPGARDAFEKACETLFREHYPDKNVQIVEVKHGDGGIDIFVGNYPTEPITVIQCKFFINELQASQHSQINKSFIKAKNATKYVCKDWILAISKTFNSDEHEWWGRWKAKKEIEFSLDKNFIKLKAGNQLIDLLKKYHLYNQVFKINELIQINNIDKNVNELLEIHYTPKKDYNIINEIFDFIFINSKSVKIENSRDKVPELTKKIELNFTSQYQERVKEIFINSWKKKITVGKFVQNQLLKDDTRVFALKDKIQEEYCKIKNTANTFCKVEDYKIFEQISCKIVPLSEKDNLDFISNAKAIVLYFFEFCDFGQKTEDEINKKEINNIFNTL